MTDNILHVDINRLQAHPDNPRIVTRDDVVDSIAAQIKQKGHFDVAHSLIVRPMGDAYQIVAGHHRWEAAKRAELKEVPCWVRKMSDHDAYMLLAMSNEQSGMTPLEWGVHALGYVKLSRVGAGRGNSGGLSEYAKSVNRTKSSVSETRRAAIVFKNVLAGEHFEGSFFSERYKHLYEISKTDKSLWPLLCQHLIAREWSAADTKAVVTQVKKFDVPYRWTAYLPLPQLVKNFLKDEKFNAKYVAGLVQFFDGLYAIIESYEDIDTAPHFEGLHDWLSENTGAAAWSIHELAQYQNVLIEDLEKDREELEARKKEAFKIHEGLFQPVTSDFEPESFDFIITDPPYPREFVPQYSDLAKMAARLLKPGGSLLAMSGQSYLPELMTRLSEHLTYHWTLAYLTPGGQATQLFERKVNTFWKPILWFVKGEYNDKWIGDVSTSPVNDNDKMHHKWGQSVAGMTNLVERFIFPNDKVLDPFMGAGTTGISVLNLGGYFVGIDDKPENIQIARGRLTEVVNSMRGNE